MPQKILFVCLGNICRSPAAEAIVRAKAHAAGLTLTVDSCGTGPWHIGDPPFPPMQHAAAARGYGLADLRGRQLQLRDFVEFDLILAMDRANLVDLRHAQPPDSPARLELFLDGLADPDVPDPYYSGDFDGALDLIEEGATRLIGRLARP